MKLYRVAQERYAQNVQEMLSGDGAARYGGRWNSIGIPAVYCSQSLSLCALELLVHLPRGVLARYRYIEIDIPEDWILPLEYEQISDSAITQPIGDALLHASETAAFSVASLINPLERNIVLNPEHMHFHHIKYSDIQPFPLDARLQRR